MALIASLLGLLLSALAMRRRRRQQTPQYRPPLVEDGPVSFSPSSKSGTSHAGGGSHYRVLYRPASPRLPAGPDAKNKNSRRKRRAPRCNPIIISSNRGGAYMTGPIAFPPKDTSPDEIVRWFLDQQKPNNKDELSASDDDGNDDAKSVHEKSRCKENDEVEVEEWERMQRLEAQRRARNRYLSSQIESGGARIDIDGRIVPTTANDDGGAGPVVDGDDEAQENSERSNDINGGNPWDGIYDARFAPIVGLRYDDVGTGRRLLHGNNSGNGMPNPDDNDVEFIPVPGSSVAVASANGNVNGTNTNPRGRAWRRGEGRQQQPQAEHRPNGANVEAPAAQPPPSLTFRRICFAVFAVVTAFVCIMLQTLPLLESARTIDPVLDPVLKEIVVLRDMADHLLSCGNLRRDRPKFGFSYLLPTSGNGSANNDDVRRGKDDGMSTESTTFLNNRRVLASSHRFPHLREAWTSIVASSLYSISFLQCWTIYPFAPASDRKLDCQEGVVHIPSVTVLKERYEEALIRDRAWQYPSEWPNLQEMTEVEKNEAKKLKQLYRPYKDGVDLTWSLPCAGGSETLNQSANDHNNYDEYKSSSICQLSAATTDDNAPRPTLLQRLKRKISSKKPSTSNSTCSVEPISDSQPVCFRGIADGIINDDEVDAALRLASDLIGTGGDHLQVRRDVQTLRRHLPTVLAKVGKQFRERHGVTCRLEPMAFRIFAALPMEGEPLSTPLAGSIHSKYAITKRRAQLVSAVNHTVYHEWEAENRDRNDQAPFHLLRQLRTMSHRKRPFRDPCVLMSDRQRSPDFSYHSSVFLSDGAGIDHSGGTELYVDAHRRNKNPRRRIRRGILIDASRGRMVLSSGGDENKRCRMPMRAGIRAVLQIWWGCKW